MKTFEFQNGINAESVKTYKASGFTLITMADGRIFKQSVAVNDSDAEHYEIVEDKGGRKYNANLRNGFAYRLPNVSYK